MSDLALAQEPVEAELARDAQSPVEIVEARQASTALAGIDPALAALIANPSLDLARVRAVLDLRKEVEQETARKAFNAAMAVVKARIPIIIKNAENTDNKSSYATLDSIGEKVDGILAESGIATSFYPVPGAAAGHVKVECVVSHVDGYERRFEAEVPFDKAGKNGTVNKTDIHAWRSATTYARRTLYEMIFDIKSKKLTKDDDGNAAGRRMTINEKQAAEIRALVEATSTDEAKMLDGYSCEQIEDLSPVQFGEVRVLLEQKKAKLAKAQAKGGQTDVR